MTDAQNRRQATGCERPPLAGLSASIKALSLCAKLLGWGGRISNLNTASWKSDALACRRKDVEPLSVEVHKRLETFDFREPYRIGLVQSLGEKRPIRRIMDRHCRSGVQSSNEKSPMLLGLFAHEFAWRIQALDQTGGAMGIRTAGTSHCQTNHVGDFLVTDTHGFKPVAPSAGAPIVPCSKSAQ